MNLDQVDIRDAFFDRIYELTKINKNFVILSADMEAFSLNKFAKKFPDKYLNVGVSEQNMINVATGLAISGKTVFCYSIGSFATLRCYEQIKVNVCSLKLPVIIIGAGAGFSFGYDGPTHHGHQDLSSMRLLPEMSILELSSNDLARKSVDFAFENNGPMYIRLDKGPFPEWKEKKIDFKKGFRVLKSLNKINLITNGYMARRVIKVAEILSSKGIECGVVDLFRFKPFPNNFFEEIINVSDKIISIEESCITGGLATSISECMAQNNSKCKFLAVASPDKQFIEYGDREWFHQKYNLDERGIVDSVLEFI